MKDITIQTQIRENKLIMKIFGVINMKLELMKHIIIDSNFDVKVFDEMENKKQNKGDENGNKTRTQR
jgi:hypothetical protein|tara:strand:- start:612 stop:812 length:201 start_codon:yes stop_codon:yes gene_type:complete